MSAAARFHLQGVLKATIVGNICVNGVARQRRRHRVAQLRFRRLQLDVRQQRRRRATALELRRRGQVLRGRDERTTPKSDRAANASAVAIDSGSNSTHTFCGVVSYENNQTGAQALAERDLEERPTPRSKRRSHRSLPLRLTSKPRRAAAARCFTTRRYRSRRHVPRRRRAGLLARFKPTGRRSTSSTTPSRATPTNASGAVGGWRSVCSAATARSTRQAFANNKVIVTPARRYSATPTITIQNSLFANNVGNNPGAPMQCQVTATGDHNLQFPANHTSGGAPRRHACRTSGFSDPKLAAIGDNDEARHRRCSCKRSSPARSRSDQTCPAADQQELRPGSGCTSGAKPGM